MTCDNRKEEQVHVSGFALMLEPQLSGGAGAMAVVLLPTLLHVYSFLATRIW